MQRPFARSTDVCVTAAELYLLPVETRMPLKFGREELSRVTCARVRLIVHDRLGRVAEGWGETPLSVPWVWPSPMSYADREAVLIDFCRRLTQAWPLALDYGHPLEIGASFQGTNLPALRKRFNEISRCSEPMPHLAALVCCSPFDIALHDAYGQLVGEPVYRVYGAEHLSRDLSHFLTPAPDSAVDFRGAYPEDFFDYPPPDRLPVWHLVGGLDPLTDDDREGPPIGDGYPETLREWIEQDGLTCLKIKLRGADPEWDFRRLESVAAVAADYDVRHLTADFNCTVTDPKYVTAVLDRLEREHPQAYEKLLYVEQPFPYDLSSNQIDTREISERIPLLMDESAHDWRLIRLGRSLGWNGVALKTCKTQTGALLSLCWAKAHGMHLMVQDLTNPMLAQIPHVQLAAHAGTMMGVESNAMQFYPEASASEAAVHPGLYNRVDGMLDLGTIAGPGFGYRLDDIDRRLPAPEVSCER
ncbi:mandelate racemase/muconate lactonizing enzyme family protein [Botrimarina sp.]|uniref:mandelate racemase/muconate lactonizing enzyme family protein n=1 Tax=Botrimarina sp. TaxID=2795802 RepID=UPI0032EF1AE1